MSGRHVVVGVDGSIISTRAQDVAAAEAVRRSVALAIVYAVPDLDVAGPVLAASAARSRARHPGLVVRLSAVASEPAAALVARGAHAALTVVGTRALGGFASLASRSVAHQVAELSHRPLLIVGPGHLTLHAETGEVLLAVERDTDTEAAGFAFEESVRRGARLRFLHTAHYRPRVAGAGPGGGVAAVAAGGDHRGPAHQRQQQQQRRQHQRQDEANSPVSDRDLISATAGADVVIIAYRRHGVPGHPRHTPTVHALLHHAHCPVLLIPTGPPNTPLP
ncbi:universal stress protein [Streptomyces sp. NBC_01317]|uniref:universal stress protein n=1 Tax=Streptomyces sp. NBC_01317 TaxID=2903822 RepID=UPI002E161D68|nr:universal stress protein [Streptomyces sp. NBC_01317]